LKQHNYRWKETKKNRYYFLIITLSKEKKRLKSGKWVVDKEVLNPAD
jgi:hypothetical protein